MHAGGIIRGSSVLFPLASETLTHTGGAIVRGTSAPPPVRVHSGNTVQHTAGTTNTRREMVSSPRVYSVMQGSLRNTKVIHSQPNL